MSQSQHGEITQLLERVHRGEDEAREKLVTLLYSQLHRMARGQRMRRRVGDTLNTTALVHEAYIKLLGNQPPDWRSRGHFLAVAATAMRHILIDYAEKMGARKRGGDLRRTTLLDGSAVVSEERAAELLALDEALTRLSEVDPRLTRLVELRFFAGLTVPEVAEAMGLSESTVGREWRKAKALLFRLLADDRSTDDDPPVSPGG